MSALTFLYQAVEESISYAALIGDVSIAPFISGYHRKRQIECLEQLHLAVVTTNQAAYQLYHSLGFQVYGTEPKALLRDSSRPSQAVACKE